MKIGMMSAWNTDSGVAIHAELIGREWVRKGHKLKVFTFIKDDFHGDGLTAKIDEPFVVRCFGTSTKTKFLDPRPIITEKYYDVFIVQDLRMLPYQNLLKIYPLIRKKSKIVVHVLHENSLPEEPWFYMFDWDAVIYFDKRQKFIKKVYENSYHIPFPCAPLRKFDQEKARKQLNLPLNKKIILIFAQRGYAPYLPSLPNDLKDKILLLILSSKNRVSDILEAYSKSPNIEVRVEDILSWEELDKYVFASDAVILHKFRSRGHAVVSSTIFQILGTKKPFLVPKYSDFFHPLNSEVLKYENNLELGQLISDIARNDKKVKYILKKAEKYVKANIAEKIAEDYVKLFKKLIQTSV